MLFRKLWRTIGVYKSQFISMIIMIALGIGVFIGFNMEWVSIEKNTDYFFDATCFADYRIVNEQGFSEEETERIRAIKGVENAARYLSVNADVKELIGDSVALTITENKNISGFMVMEGDEYDDKSSDGIWISRRYADKNDIKTGDKLTFLYKGIELSGEVKGLVISSEYLICVRDETQLMPDYETFGFAYISPKMYEEAVGSPFYPQINVISNMDKGAFTEVVDEELKKTSLILTKDEIISYAQAQGEVEEGKTMGSLLPVLFLLIAVLTMITTMHRITAKEKTQIGTLKALGFKDKRILRHYTSYASMIGMIGIVIGIAIGYAMAWYIMNPNGTMGTYFDMPEWKLYLPWFCYLILAIIFALLTFIGYLSTRKMLSGTAADALRPYTPKKMKALFIERTKLFHRLPFGTRWNLRDTMRHKSRTAMSLIGVIGCIMIIVCALGMRDTMNAFLDLYYDGATNYSSRIYLSDDATTEDFNRLVSKYGGDSSASVSVSLEGKAVSLDIYHVENDKVRFPDENSDFLEISDDGAYICMRIAKEYDLEPGDTLKISPYGTSDEYTLKVAGTARSISENIVITKAYADSLSIPYVMRSIYTDTEKSDIDTDEAIKSIQSKQMIIDSFDGFMEIMNMMIVLLIGVALVLCLVVLYNLGVMSYTERYREMATLKVVGFKDKKIGRLLIGQNLWTTVIGILIGLPLGVLALDYMLKMLASEYELMLVLGPITYIVSIALTVGVSLLVSLMVSRKNRKIDMVEALKGAE